MSEKFDYLIKKRTEVLSELKPFCEVFGITDYDYEIDVENQHETLRIYDIRIGCTCNSILAVIDELIGYIFVKRWCKHRSLGAFEVQSLNVIKRNWKRGNKK